ncbi:hypothetical protein [Pseudoxanthomonas sp. SE1]|uniref:hypothetical protein n=1 Tax=Pseudoxanthomonas sp. SE1 TaxID=1664560 RepID=UPI00240E8E9E|nr:hypothetical protein [Pseudoxanthomonas sp. SE1]WFC40807.1 hypothetical protein OY559_13435 [Pseudoxanthomonas sp. SE1]
MPKPFNFTRIKRLHDARKIGPDESAKVEQQIAEELVDYEVLERDQVTRANAHRQNAHLRPFQAAEEVSDALDLNLAKKSKGKYDPKYANARTVEDLWVLRQAIDSIGMPYQEYIGSALQYVGRPNGRNPRITQLTKPDVVMHVARKSAGAP